MRATTGTAVLGSGWYRIRHEIPAKNNALATCNSVNTRNINVIGAWIACHMRNAPS